MNVRSLAVLSLSAVLACTASGLDEANRDSSSDQKSLSRPIVQTPGFRGALGMKNSHSPRASAVTSAAPTGAHLTHYGGNIIKTAACTNVYWGGFWTSGAGP